MKEPISGETVLKNSSRKSSGIKKRSRVRIRIHPLILSLYRSQKSINAGYIKMLSRNVHANRVSTKPGAILKLTSQESLNKQKDPPWLWRPRGMRSMWNPHKPTRSCLMRCSRTTPWSWKILQRKHNPIEHRLRCWPKQLRSYQLNSPPSPQI